VRIQDVAHCVLNINLRLTYLLTYLLTCLYKVNGMNVESCYHDDAVTMLKNAGDNVLLALKYFEPASGLLSLKGTSGGQKLTLKQLTFS